jgi:cytochrome c biogenesis protein CcmG/thiol:disulfide interchange protein DsbE
LLAQSVARSFEGRVAFVSENYGDSALAKRFGVTRYPAIFVDDVLVATPNDFGFYGRGAKREGGRYAPLKSAAAHERFRADLTRMIELLLAGRKSEARAVASPSDAIGVAAYPAVTFTDLDGRAVPPSSLDGRVALVEFWATWCPPCRGTLAWLGELRKRYGDRIVVIAAAIESDEAAVRRLAAELDLPLTWVIGKPDAVRAFGDVGAVPTLLVFDRKGRSAGAFYGAPPGLHAEAEAKLDALLRQALSPSGRPSFRP